jgi:glycosyltransferase involved in cell wall biosynthesis
MSSKKTVGYILKKFPVLSETFILNELLELEAQGVPIHIFSLERPNDPRFHNDLPKLKTSISYVPNISDVTSLQKHFYRAANYYGKHFRKALAYVLKHSRPSLMWRFLQSCYVANEARRFRIGHVHAHFATRPTSVAFLASMIADVPYSFTAHAMDIFKIHLSTKSLSKKIKKARFVVTVSEYNREHLMKFADGNRGKIVKIHNGIRLDSFKPNEEIDKKPLFIFICVARFVEKKGHRVLVEACDILRRQGLSFQCWLVGKGKLRSFIRSQIKTKNLSDCMKLLGPRSQVEVMNLYRSAHAYVLPCIVGSDGNRDGLPVSIVEALATGLPVITTPMTGNPEVIEENRNGLLVPFNDAKALAEAMGKLMKDSNLYERLRRNTRASVESRFDLHETTKMLTTLFGGVRT